VHFILVLGLLLGAFVQQVDLLNFYGEGVLFVQAVPWPFYAWVLGACCVLVLVTVILEQMKSYGLMYLLSKSVFELSLLAVSVLSCFAVFYAWQYLMNIWFDFFPLNLIPYLGVMVAMVMVQLFDFNYPYKKRVLSGLLLSIVSIILVTVHLM
ncbi:MAG: hypothetical protein PF495_07640, partial [Spirochaetales bacterium]|nr:hypothetical protein [Spirochaetales bacterium]